MAIEIVDFPIKHGDFLKCIFLAFLLGHMALDVHHCLQHVILGERK